MPQDDKFFDDQGDQIDTTQTPDKIQFDGREYTPDELRRRIGLSDAAIESEEKYKTKIDRVWPEYTKSRQEVSELRKKLDEVNAQAKIPQTDNTQQTRQELTEEVRQQALEQAEKLGIGPKATADLVRNIVREEFAADRLLADINTILSQAENDGKPVTNSTELLDYMSDTGIKNPQIAYELMFKEDLAKIDSEKLGSLKRPGLVTTTQSTAGSKVPSQPRPPKNREELMRAVSEELARGANE